MESFLQVIDPSKPCLETVENPAKLYTYPLDPFQQHALAAIESGKNVLVTAKTGSGKTLVGEYLIHKTFRDGGRVFYTTPIKSLSNQKFNDLKKEFGVDRVGIMTGDIKFNPDAQVIVMTTEILRNLLFKQGTSTEHLGITASLTLKGLAAVVFDEVHYINDRDRGRVWEETLILLDPKIQMVLLSATIDHPERFAGWLGELKQRPTVLISTEYRVVPLTHGVLIGQQFQTLMDAKNIYFEDTYRKWLEWRNQKAKEADAFQRKVKDQRRAGFEGPVDGKPKQESFVHQLNQTVRALDEKSLLPALCFCFSRKGCERYAGKVEATLLDASDAAKVSHIWDFHLHPYKSVLETLPQAHTLRALAERGIAYHHSGLLPILKEIIEILFSRGLIRLLFATETFAVGLNMPTKTVLFFGLEKFSDETLGMRVLRTDEYLQMAGRAGRRGLDPVGTVIYLPEREPLEPGQMKAMMVGGRNPIQSKMQFHYEFLLKSLQANSVGWMRLMEKSYWYQQHQEAIQKSHLAISTLEEKCDKMNIEEGVLTELEKRERLELDLKSATNAKKKQLQRDLESWKNTHMGPKWETAWKLFPQRKELQKEISEEKEYLQQLLSHKESLDPLVKLLQEKGFLNGDQNQTATEISKESLTEKGVLATEINEGHSLLMVELYLQNICKDLSAKEILAVLSGFIGEEGSRENTPTLESLAVPEAVKECLYKVDDIACDYIQAEKRLDVRNEPMFWDLNSGWIEPIWRWMDGVDATVICRDYELFEGNLMRAVLKVANLLEEWTTLATFKKDTEMLQKLQGAEALLKHDIVVSDSLYLRL